MFDTLNNDDSPAPTLRDRMSLWFGKTERRSSDSSLALVLSAGPSPWVVWTSEGVVRAAPEALTLLGLERLSSLEDIQSAFQQSDGEALAEHVTALRRAGTGFDLAVALSANSRTIEFSGRRAAGDGFDVLWLRLASPQTIGASRFEKLLDGLATPAWQRDLNLKIVWCNRAYADAVGHDRDSVLQESREIAINVLNQDGRGIAERARSRGEPQSEARHIVVGGARRLLEITEYPASPDSPAFGFAFDRTKIEEIEGALERHLSAHAEVLEQLRTAIVIFGSDKRVKFFNGAMCELWNLSEQWMAATPTMVEMLELLRERRQLPEQADFRRYRQERVAMFTSLIESHEELMYRPDGTVLRLLIVPHPMGGLMFTYEDVTSRLALESSYNTLIAVQRETLDNLAEGIAVFGGDGRLSLWNPPFAQLWGLTPEELDAKPHIGELVGRMAPLFSVSDQADTMRDVLVGNALGRTPRLGRISLANAKTLEYRSVPLPDGAVLNSFMDVTDSVRVEQALRDRNDALMAADQLKLDFLANVSYQLRTPLNAMIGFSEILTNRYFGELNERQTEYVDGVLQAGRRLEALIDAILDLSSIEAGYMKLEPASIDVERMIDDVCAITGEWAQRERIDLVARCAAGVGSIVADERRLKQVLLNLVSNAIKFTRAGGRIELSAEPHGDEVALIVSDNGVGIPEEDRERVFAPFERARQAHARSGAGVGLALVKRFVAMHGGRVELVSDPAQGTRVTCILPRRAVAELDKLEPAGLTAGAAV